MHANQGGCEEDMLKVRILVLLGLCLLASHLCFAADQKWKAGVGKISITPRQSLWLAGYAARTKPSEGTSQELYAKALALEDRKGRRAVLVTTDLLGFTARLNKAVAERVEKQYSLPKDRVVFNSSHTHSGPVIDRQLAVAYPMTPEQWSDVDACVRELEDKIVNVIGVALKDLASARLSFGRTEANFNVNRRTLSPREPFGGVNQKGPVDTDVPVLRIDGANGKLRAVVFGYSCHNVTLGPDFYQYHGDYAGAAQEWLETRHPGAIALFVAGCGADANPNPRGGLDVVRGHGETLATAVDKALDATLRPVGGPLKCAYEVFPLPFATVPTREELQKRLQDENIYQRRHAQLMLETLDHNGRLPVEYPYPLQVWQFGPDLTLVVMAGEVFVDFALRLKQELGPERLWVAGYSNDVFAYIPSLRILQEGGYEGGGAMLYYGQPGPFAASVEEIIVRKVHELVQRTR